MKLTKKQVYEFTRIYIGSELLNVHKESLWNIASKISNEDMDRIVEALNMQGTKILGNRKKCGDAEEVLKVIWKDYK